MYYYWYYCDLRLCRSGIIIVLGTRPDLYVLLRILEVFLTGNGPVLRGVNVRFIGETLPNFR